MANYKIRKTFMFPISDKLDWVKRICHWRNVLVKASYSYDCIKIIIGPKVTKTGFTPFHIVTLSCFIDFIKKKEYLIYLDIQNEELREFVYRDISLTAYWRVENIAHIDSPDASRLNLWRVISGRSEEYEESVHRYFSAKFPDTDFLMLKTCLAELYFNVFDHAKADGVAFSYIHYDEQDDIIHIAICDFGEGIASTLRKAYPKIADDMEALQMSIKKGVTAKSNAHNAGFGLDNILSAITDKKSVLRIVSNRALLLYDINGVKPYSLDFEMKGTLIYMDLPISSFEKSEINDEYTFL